MFSVLILQNRGVWGPEACLGVFQGGGEEWGLADLIPYLLFTYLFFERCTSTFLPRPDQRPCHIPIFQDMS